MLRPSRKATWHPLPKYMVGVAELHYSYREVEADSPQDAIVKAKAMDELPDELHLEYSHTLDSDVWKVETVIE